MARKKKTQKKAPKRRNVDLQIHIERGGAGAGHHKSKGQRGEGKGSGKWGRHPKHRGQTRYNPSALENAGSTVLYHIGSQKPIPRPYKGDPAEGWEHKRGKVVREPAVFLTPDWISVGLWHGKKGNVYAYSVPNWVIREAGGIYRYDNASEVIIPESLWSEVEFLGKSLGAKEAERAVQRAWYEIDAKMAEQAADWRETLSPMQKLRLKRLIEEGNEDYIKQFRRAVGEQLQQKRKYDAQARRSEKKLGGPRGMTRSELRRKELRPKYKHWANLNPAQICLKPTIDPNTVDIDQLLMGIKVELEHTNDRGLAERIALHHLAEDPLYYSHLLEMEEKYAVSAHSNPAVEGPKDTYDPREEQIRAVRQGLYESGIRKLMGVKYNTPFRNAQGQRLDLRAAQIHGFGPIKKTINSYMFQMGTRVQQKGGRLVAGTQVVTPKSAAESQARFDDPDKALRNRQDYEETLALARKGSFFRVVPEITKNGLLYFVWPMVNKQETPFGYETKQRAEGIKRYQNQSMNPLKDPSLWWKPPSKKYTKKDLSHWLPPAEMFSMKGIKRASRKTAAAPEKVRTAPGKVYTGTDPHGRPCWKVRGQKGYFYSKEKALKRAG